MFAADKGTKVKLSVSYSDIEGIVCNEMGVVIHPDAHKSATTLLTCHLSRFKVEGEKPSIHCWLKTIHQIKLPKPNDSDSHQFVFCFGRYLPKDIPYESHVVIWVDKWEEASDVAKQAMRMKPKFLEVVANSYASDEIYAKMKKEFPWVKLTPVGTNKGTTGGIAELKQFLLKNSPGQRGIPEFGWKRKPTDDAGPPSKKTALSYHNHDSGDRDADDDANAAQLRSDLSHVEGENAELKKALSRVEGEKAELLRKIHSGQETHNLEMTNEQLKEAESRIEKLMSELKKSKVEKDMVDNDLKKAQDQIKLAESFKRASDLNLEATQKQLDVAKDQVKIAEDKLDISQVKLGEVEGKLLAAESKLNDAEEALNANPEWKRMQELEGKNKDLETQLASALEKQRRNARSNSEISELMDKLKKAEEKNTKLEEKNGKLEEKISKLKDDISTLKAKSKNTGSPRNQVRKAVDRLG